jgi:anti-anti-sigma factor
LPILGPEAVRLPLLLIQAYAFGFLMGEAMEFPTEINGDKAYIRVEGDLDSEQSGEALRKAFNEVFDKGKRTIVLDMSKVQIINSYGIGKVLMCYKRLKAENGVLMVSPLQGFVKETFELLLLDKLLPTDA